MSCFSVSTDDDKVVSWHWEEVKGPLREEKASGDTAVLTLTNLVPGNYTFRYVLYQFFCTYPVLRHVQQITTAKPGKPVCPLENCLKTLQNKQQIKKVVILYQIFPLTDSR